MKKLSILLSLVFICHVSLFATSWRSVVAVVTDEGVSERLLSDIDSYMNSIRKDGKEVIHLTDVWNHPDSIRKQLINIYHQTGGRLEGIVLIGDIPVPMIRDAQHLTTAFKMDQSRDWKESSIPSDRFYDDFDLQFDYIKQDEDVALYHYYSLRSDSPQYISSEIYSARIKPPVIPGKDRYEVLSDYLNKVVLDKESKREVKKVLHFGGSGYNSESINARMDEGWVLRSHFAKLGSQRGNSLEFINFDQDNFVKFRLLAKLTDRDLDIAVLHHHGSEEEQLLSKTPATSAANQFIENTKRFFRSKIRSSRDTTASKEYYIREYGVPESWVEGAFDPKQAELDSIYSASMDISIADTYNYSFGAKFIMFDACFNGSFHLDDYLSGHYPFNDGGTIVAKANSVNTLQDIWSTELIGLLSEGVCVGNWAKHIFTLESHLIGDPTLSFESGLSAKSKLIPERDIVKEKNNPKFWRGVLNDLAKGKIEGSSDIKALALVMLAQNQAITSAELMEFLKNDADPIVRLESYMILKRALSDNLVEATILGIKDSYELLRRLSLITAAKSGDPAFLATAAEKYFDPALTPREWFQLKYLIDQYSYDTVTEVFSKYRAESPYWPTEEAYQAFLKGQKRSFDSEKTDLAKLWNEELTARSRRLSIVTHRNLCHSENLSVMIDYLKRGENDQLRLEVAETMGWYLYSWRRDFIVSELKKQMEQEDNLQIKNEIEKTLNRFKAQYTL